jgi:hypothetical protein
MKFKVKFNCFVFQCLCDHQVWYGFRSVPTGRSEVRCWLQQLWVNFITRWDMNTGYRVFWVYLINTRSNICIRTNSMNRSSSREDKNCSRNFWRFIESKVSVPFSQELTTGRYLDTDEFSPHPSIVFISDQCTTYISSLRNYVKYDRSKPKMCKQA